MFSGIKTIFKIRLLIIGIVAAACFFSVNNTVIGADAGTSKIKREADTIRRKIESGKRDVKAMNKKEQNVLKKLGDTDRALNKAGKNLSFLKHQVKALDKKIEGTNNALETLKLRVAKGKKTASNRIVALYKLQSLGQAGFLASAESINMYLERKSALERILKYDETVLKRLDEDISRVEAARDRLESQKHEKTKLEGKYAEQAKTLRSKKKTRSKILAKIRKKRALKLASIKYLKKSAAALDKRINELVLKSKNTRKSVNPSSSAFTSLKGLLNMPVKGKIISKFGEFINPEFKVRNFRGGIDIQAGMGEPIRAVHGGEVIFADWFKGYGNMIIIDHGDSYYTLYAHADELRKSKGNRVKSAEVIATVGETGSSKGPGLHFQIRHHGKPMNPVGWLKKG